MIDGASPDQGLFRSGDDGNGDIFVSAGVVGASVEPFRATREREAGRVVSEKSTLDLKGLQCPLPVLRANKAMRNLAPGDEMAVLVTDPAAPADFRAYCESSGHDFLALTEDAAVFTIVLRKTVS